MSPATECIMIGLVVASAHGQSFVWYGVRLANLSDPTDSPEEGDILRVTIFPRHDGLSLAAGRVDILMGGVELGDVPELVETGGTLPPELDPTFDRGRHPLTRINGSDKPETSPFPGDRPVSVRETHGTIYEGRGSVVITDDAPLADAFFDFTTTPPGLGGLVGTFPISHLEALFVFDYVYNGRSHVIEVVTSETAFLWAGPNDFDPVEVPAMGSRIRIPEPPALMVIGLLAIGRRRGSSIRQRGGRPERTSCAAPRVVVS